MSYLVYWHKILRSFYATIASYARMKNNFLGSNFLVTFDEHDQLEDTEDIPQDYEAPGVKKLFNKFC